MRRCGRASCLVGLGLIAATFVAGGAFAAPGGNGKGHVPGAHGDGHGGKGLALAKGHAKRPVATPQLTPTPSTPAPQTSAEPERRPAPPAPAREAAPPGAETRHNHVTICHATGSGRYIVISPNVNGAVHGHLAQHDDFVYTGSCARPSPPPPADVGGSPPDVPLPATTHPPRDPPSTEASPPPPSAKPRGELPFTGLPVVYLFAAGGILLAAGSALAAGPYVSATNASTAEAPESRCGKTTTR